MDSQTLAMLLLRQYTMAKKHSHGTAIKTSTLQTFFATFPRMGSTFREAHTAAIAVGTGLPNSKMDPAAAFVSICKFALLIGVGDMPYYGYLRTLVSLVYFRSHNFEVNFSQFRSS